MAWFFFEWEFQQVFIKADITDFEIKSGVFGQVACDYTSLRAWYRSRQPDMLHLSVRQIDCLVKWYMKTGNLCEKRFERSTIKYCVVQIPALSGLFFMSVCLLFIIITGAAHHMFAIKKNASLGNMNKPTPYNKEMLTKRVFFGFFITFIHYFIAFSKFNWVAGVR